MSQAHEAESAAGREEQSQDLPADSTIVLPRSIRSTRRPKSSATFFDRNYMADEKEVKKAIQFESTDYHVAFQRWTLWLAFSLGFSDALVMAISTFLVSWGHGFRFWFIDHKGTSWLVPPWQLVAVFTLVWIASMWIVGGYHRHLMGEGYDLYAKIVSAAFAALLIAGLVCLITRIQLPRWQVFWPIAIATFLTCAERWAWRRFIHRMRLKNRMRYPVTLVGTWNGIIKAVNDIASNAGLGYRVIAVAPIIINNDGTVDADPAAKSNTRHNLWARSHDFRVLVFDSHMAATAREMGSQVVLLTDGIGRGSRDFAAFSLAVQASGMELSIPVTSTGDVNGEFNFYLHNTADTMPVLTSSLPQFRWFRQLTKRLFDFVLSVVALVLAAIPMVIIAIIVVIALVVGGYFVYNRYFKGKKTTPKKSQNSTIISSNVIVYSAGEPLTGDQQNTTSVKKGRKSTHRSHNLPVILSLTNTTAHVRSAKKPKAGQIMSAAGSKIAPNGVLRRITSVTPSSQGQNEYDLRTKPAALTDAVTKANQTSKVMLPVTSDQIASMPPAGTFGDLDLASLLPKKDAQSLKGDLLDCVGQMTGNMCQSMAKVPIYKNLNRNMTDRLTFSGGQKQKFGFATVGKHEVSVSLKIVKKKVTLTVTDHVKASVLDRWDSRAQAAVNGIVYYFDKPMTVMIGRMPLTLKPSMGMATLAAGNVATGGTANLVTNIDHTIGAKYQTGKPIKAINEDSSALGNSTYTYNTVTHGPVASYDFGYMKVSVRDYVSFLSRFAVNGFNVETGVMEWEDTQGSYQKIPAGEDSKGAFTLPGVTGQLRGSLAPRSYILSSIASGTDSKLAGLDGTEPVVMKNIYRNKKMITQPVKSFGKVRDLSWLTNGKYTNSKDSHYETIMTITNDGSFTANHFELNGADWPTGEAAVHGQFNIPADASSSKPFVMHLKSFVYEHEPDKNQQHTVSIPDGGPQTYHAIALGFYDQLDPEKINLQNDLLRDYIVYQAGTPESSIPKPIRDSMNYSLTQAGGNGKTNITIIAGLKNGQPISDAFMDENYANNNNNG